VPAAQWRMQTFDMGSARLVSRMRWGGIQLGRCAAASVEQGSNARTSLGGKDTMSGWDSARSLRELAADRPLRGCVGRTGSESPYLARRENRQAPRGGLFVVIDR